jgi:hypothetical protein
MKNETYYYGQGKLFIAPRTDDGRPGAWRWVGDVSSLNIALTADYKSKHISQGGKRGLVQRHKIAESATLTAVWHEIISENLSVYLHGIHEQVSAKKASSTFTGVINAGDRYTLDYPGVWDVLIPGLTLGVDYTVDAMWGAVEFLKAPHIKPLTVHYKHSGSANTAIYTHDTLEVAVRYEGINLAEQGDSVIVELYRVDFDPAALIELINNANELPGVNTTGTLLLDTLKSPHDVMGQYGRVVSMAEMISIHTRLNPIYTTGGVGGEFTTIYPKAP